MARPDVTPIQNNLEEKAEFIDYFRQGFAKDSRDAFLNHFLHRIQPDATYRQPLSRGGSGHAGFRRLFTCLFVEPTGSRSASPPPGPPAAAPAWLDGLHRCDRSVRSPKPGASGH